MFLITAVITAIIVLSYVDASVKLCDKGSMAGRFCSEGKVKDATRGDVHLPGMMRQILENASYHKEIITLACTEDHLLGTASFVSSLHASGYYHIILITLESSNRDTCSLKSWPKGVSRPAACVWSSAPTEKGYSLLPLIYHHRHRFNARAARMGYNVMSMDSDVIFFHEPYQYLKSPPLSSYQLLVQRDGGGGCNCGWYYIQNASMDGPVSWLISQVPDRYLRFSEDCRRARIFVSPDPAASIVPMSNFECGARFGYEQNTLCDAIASFAAGRPLYAHIMNHGGLQGHKAAHFHESNRQVFKGFLKGESPVADANSSMPIGWKQVDYHDTEHWQASSTFVPNSKGSWPRSLGGKLFGTTRGNLSRAFLDELKDDTGHYPNWPDLDFETNETRSKWSGEEKIAFAPGWLVDAWVSRGFSGAWDGKLIGGDPQQVIGHVVSVEGEYQPGKQIIKMALDPNWRPGQHQKRFFASTHSNPLPKIILFHPRLVPRLIQPFSALDLQDLALMIITLGRALNRAVVFPSVLCQSPAIPCRWSPFSKMSRDQFPYASHDTFLSFGSLTLDLSNKSSGNHPTGPAGKWNRTCFWGQFFYSQCYAEGKSLHPIEFHHLVQTDNTYSPSPSNTLLFPSSDASRSFDMRHQPNICPSKNETERIILINHTLHTTCDDQIDEKRSNLLNESGLPIPGIQYSELFDLAGEMKDYPVIYAGSLALVSWASMPSSAQESISAMTGDRYPEDRGPYNSECNGLRRSVATMRYTPWSERNIGFHCPL